MTLLLRRLTSITFLVFLPFTAPILVGAELRTANVMAPLFVQDWAKFDQQLREAKAIGVDAVSTDVWWGNVEARGDQQFDWSYYDRISDAIIKAGLKWVPILSFHACHDRTFDVGLPQWIWTRFPGMSADDLRYRNECGKTFDDVLTLWADDQVIGQYREVMDAFQQHFKDKAQHILEINISCGTSGELRYPSYDDATDSIARYPGRGRLQCYGRLAVEDFRRFVMQKYVTLAEVNRIWGTQVTDIAQITIRNSADDFFKNGNYLHLPYEKDLYEWLNQSLIRHGSRMIQTAMTEFSGSMKDVTIGIKIPGVHWRVADPDTPRVAEVNAGLIPTNIEINSPQTAHGYAPLIAMVASFRIASHPVVLHFTCLEMGNDRDPSNFCRPEDLVFWIGEGAKTEEVTIKGENALAELVENEEGWRRIRNAFTWSSYVGLTVLRIDQVTNDSPGKSFYRNFITDFRPTPNALERSEQERGDLTDPRRHTMDKSHQQVPKQRLSSDARPDIAAPSLCEPARVTASSFNGPSCAACRHKFLKNRWISRKGILWGR